MSQSFSSYPFDAAGVDNFSHPLFINANRAPTAQDIYSPCTFWMDGSVSPKVIYQTLGAGIWQEGGNPSATTTEPGIVLLDTTVDSGDDNSTVPTSKAVYDYGQTLVLAGANIASDVAQGIAWTATNAQCIAGTANDATNAYMVSPDNLVAIFASPNGPIGATAADAGTFTDLTADGTGAVSLGSNAAGDFTVTGASTDLTLQSVGGSINVLASEAAANAIRIYASDAAGGIDVDCGTAGATLDSTGTISLDAAAASNFSTSVGDLTLHAAGACNLTSAETNSDSINVTSGGGMNIVADGAAGKDIVATCTSGSIHLTAGEAVSDAINIDSSGGFDLDAVGQVNLRSTQNAADAVVVESTVGGVQILASGASAGEDIVLTATGSSITATATEDAALNIYLHANGGVSETIKIHSDQGTGAASVGLYSDVGGISVDSGLAGAASIRLYASDIAGGMDFDCGTGGFTLDSTDTISLDSAAASNFTVTGAFDLTLKSTAGSVIINAEEAVADAIDINTAAGGIDVDAALQINIDSSQAAADAIRIFASDAGGGIDIDCGTTGIAVDSTGAISLGAAAASDFTVTGAFDLDLQSTLGSIVVNAGEAAADAIRLHASDAAGGMDFDCGTNGFTLDSTGVISIDAAGATNLTTSSGDLTLSATTNSVIMTAAEAVADAIKVNASAGGLQLLAGGGAGLDTLITNTAGSISIDAGESAADALNITASGAAGAINFSAGTGGFTFDSGMTLPVVAKTAAYDVTTSDLLLTGNTNGHAAFSFTLPAAPATGQIYFFSDVGGNAAAANITIDGNGKSINAAGASAGTALIDSDYGNLIVWYDGTRWCGLDIA